MFPPLYDTPVTVGHIVFMAGLVVIFCGWVVLSVVSCWRK